MTQKQTIYSNPQNLNYYLANNTDIHLSVNIIKSNTINTPYGKMQLAIIGSSHFLKLENQMLELLTCTHENIPKQALINHLDAKQTIFNHKFPKFHYQYCMNIYNLTSPTLFSQAEKKITSQNPTMLHYFDNTKAITTINYTLQNNKINIETWHGYPEHNTLVKTNTTIN